MKTVSKIAITAVLLVVLISSINVLPPALALLTHKASSATPVPVSKSTEDKKAHIDEWVVVPVFYATNRASVGTNDTGDYSEKTNPDGLLFGVKNYAVPVPYNSPMDAATQTKLQWQHLHGVAKKHEIAPEFDKTKCLVQDKVLSRAEIVPAFNDYRKATGNSENIIYVHGCCANFDTVMRRAAMVASHTQAPVLVYDWVSPHGFTNYLVNETMISQTIDDFCKFLTKVESLMDTKEITLIGHSMGNELVDQALVRRAELVRLNPTMPKFKEIILSNADVDVIAFLKHSNELVSNGDKTRIYFSTTDKRLRLSTFVHGGFRRVGSPGTFLSELVKIKGAQCIDITANNTGHELPYWLVANMHKYNSVGPAQGFELKEQAPGYLLLVRSSIAFQEATEDPIKCVCVPQSSMVIK